MNPSIQSALIVFRLQVSSACDIKKLEAIISPLNDNNQLDFAYPFISDNFVSPNYHSISIETVMEDAKILVPEKPSVSGFGEVYVSSELSSEKNDNSTQLAFTSGNPSVESIEGILHLYKVNDSLSINNDNTPKSKTVCMYAVPSSLTIHDLLTFTSPVSANIEHMKVIRHKTPNQYMALIKFNEQSYADEFFSAYNHLVYNSIENHVCHLAFVAKIEIIKNTETEKPQIVPSLTELPVCPVCLEQLDESVNGILTVLCNHSFHGKCLQQWSDASCPVCRCSQTPETEEGHVCTVCGIREDLWMCLICGYIGCGRYAQAHAKQHYVDTMHAFAKEIGRERVWNYEGDNYVHRLIQEKGEGKLVELPSSSNTRDADNQTNSDDDSLKDTKHENLVLEYTYLLTSQLEAQREYFEEKKHALESDYEKRIFDSECKLAEFMSMVQNLEKKLNLTVKEKNALEKKLNQSNHKLKEVNTKLSEEKDMNECLVKNQKDWQVKISELRRELDTTVKEKEGKINELEEQLRDIMFYMDAQQKLTDCKEVDSAELESSQITIAEGEGTSKNTRKQKQRKKH